MEPHFASSPYGGARCAGLLTYGGTAAGSEDWGQCRGMAARSHPRTPPLLTVSSLLLRDVLGFLSQTPLMLSSDSGQI
jgi:hypothetical protein